MATRARSIAQQLTDLTDAWLRTKAEHTQTNYRRDLAAWIGWCNTTTTDPLLAKIKDVDNWISAQRDGSTMTGKPAAEASIARRVAAVSSWYTYLQRNTASDAEPLIKHNPALTDARPKVDPDHSPTVGMSLAEADRLLEAADADGPTTSTLIRLLLMEGLRCGSPLAARIEDLGHDTGHRVLSIAVKGRREPDKIPLPPAITVSLDAMLAQRGDPASGFLFLDPRGRPMGEPYVWRLVRRLARRAGIPQANQLSPHSLRHTAITELLNDGGSLREAQDFARHKDPRTTRRYDLARGKLDGHGSYRLAGRFGQTSTPGKQEFSG